MKKIVLLTYLTESNTDMKAIFNLRKTLNVLSDSELAKFDAFDVQDVLCNCEMVCYCGELVK